MEDKNERERIKSITESSVKQSINRYLKGKTDCYFFPYNPYGGTAGVADKIGCHSGRFIAIEVKRPSLRDTKNGGLSPAQQVFRERIIQIGGVYILAYSVKEVKDYFESA